MLALRRRPFCTRCCVSALLPAMRARISAIRHTGGRAYTYNVRDVVTGVRSGFQVADGTIQQRKPNYGKGLGYSTKEGVTVTWLAHKT
jgi:hypothetical protein